MQNDFDEPIEVIRARSGRPLYHSMVELEKEALYNVRQLSETRCVTVSGMLPGDTRHAARVELRYVPSYEYIAVSCPWSLPDDENSSTGKYSIEPDDGMHKIIMPQNVVLDRVVNFAAVKGMPFWIDKLCVEQDEGSEEKEIAVQSMDIVYEKSKWTVGLLFVRMDEEYQVDILGRLLSREFAKPIRSDDGHKYYRLNSTPYEVPQILEVIGMIIEDSWWKRAWIFQEEYLSTTRMRLLIRSSHWYYLDYDMFGDTPGELDFSAVEFRKASTEFCLALQRWGTTKPVYERCESILDRAGRYSMLLLDSVDSQSLQPMSPTIFREIGTRSITSVIDVLVIASNACGYSQRLDRRKLRNTGQSLSVALLTLYILNGEILCPSATSMSSIDTNIFQFLKDATMRIRPPLGPGERGLTFTKHCRFPNVTLSERGIETHGIIWKLGNPIDSYRFGQYSLPMYLRDRIWRHRQWKTTANHLGFCEHEALWLMWYYADQHGHNTLAEYLAAFLEADAPCGYDEDWSGTHFMYLMATSVAHAILDGSNLRLGSVWRGGGYQPYTAIFIEGGNGEDWGWGNHFAFTSWVRATDHGRGTDWCTSCSSKYVSLKIAGEPESSKLPEIQPKHWVNGLCFFQNLKAEDVFVAWPRCSLGMES